MTQKRAIFEEAGESARERAAMPSGSLIDRRPKGARRAIRLWLLLLFVLVVVMITVGGLTRLTDSGLSITEWRPLTGAIPPLSEADWQAEFAKYQEIPQFQVENAWMELSDFKYIYWWEWGHRQLGRVIGLVWFLGFFGFLVARKLPAGWTGRLLWVGALGGFQGFIGWWMVSSGVTGHLTSVASYRLATHLGLAFVILGVIAWDMFLLGREERALMQARRAAERPLMRLSSLLLALAFVQILLGAMVAGIDAGRSYTDWPLIGGGLVPPEAFVLQPWWSNFFENPGLVQFIHRCVGYLLLAFGIFVWLRGRRSSHRRTQAAFNMVFGGLILQVVLGIVTLVMAAPAHVAIFHQLMAVAIWVMILRARFLSAYPIQLSVRGK